MNNCLVIGSIIINLIVVVEFSIIDVFCSNIVDGSLMVVFIEGGEVFYIYQLGIGLVQDSLVFENLFVEEYVFIIMDVNGNLF